MSTLKELVYATREQLHLYSDDSIITNEYIAYCIKTARALLLTQKYSIRSNVISNKVRQSFYKELELVSDNEFISGIDTILRTKEKISFPFEAFNLKSNIRINSGSFTDINFTFIPMERVPFVGNSKWNSGQIYTFLANDMRLYFVSNNPKVKMLENVKIMMCTENPEDAYLETIEYNPSVDFWDVEYPVDEEMVFTMIDVVIKKLTASMQIPRDKQNDSEDEPTNGR